MSTDMKYHALMISFTYTHIQAQITARIMVTELTWISLLCICHAVLPCIRETEILYRFLVTEGQQ